MMKEADIIFIIAIAYSKFHQLQIIKGDKVMDEGNTNKKTRRL